MYNVAINHRTIIKIQKMKNKNYMNIYFDKKLERNYENEPLEKLKKKQ